jgi:glycosyltransferase involved in cell wall biosynthesis
MRIAIVTDIHQLNSWYRAFPLIELQQRGHQIHLDRNGEKIAFEELREFDVVHIYRYYEPQVIKVARKLREAGVGIVWDNDDDLTTGNLGTKNEVRKNALRSQHIRAAMMSMLSVAHVVTVPSETLAAQYREWGADDVRVVENYLRPAYATGPVPRHDGVTVGWTACAEHAHDMKHFNLREVLRELLDEHPELHVMSVGIDLALPRERYTRFPIVNYRDLASHVARFDIGIAPIADIPFNRARSNVKLKEYAAVGVPWLASPIGPYAGMGEKQGGRLVPDDRWHEELSRLIRDARARRKLGKRGMKWARGETSAAGAAKWEQVMAACRERARESGATRSATW